MAILLPRSRRWLGRWMEATKAKTNRSSNRRAKDLEGSVCPNRSLDIAPTEDSASHSNVLMVIVSTLLQLQLKIIITRE